MTRLPERRSAAIVTDSNGDADVGAEPTAEAPRRLGIGWRLAVFVWLCGFVGLFLYELATLAWKVGKSAFGGPAQ